MTPPTPRSTAPCFFSHSVSGVSNPTHLGVSRARNSRVGGVVECACYSLVVCVCVSVVECVCVIVWWCMGVWQAGWEGMHMSDQEPCMNMPQPQSFSETTVLQDAQCYRPFLSLVYSLQEYLVPTISISGSGSLICNENSNMNSTAGNTPHHTRTHTRACAHTFFG